MSDFIFYLLLIALLYYFFIYLPSPKKSWPTKPWTHSQFTQTEVITEPNPDHSPELESLFDKLLKEIQNLTQQL